MKMKEEVKAGYQISNRWKAVTYKEFGRGGERSFLRGSCDLLYVSVRPEGVRVSWGDHVCFGSAVHLKL